MGYVSARVLRSAYAAYPMGVFRLGSKDQGKE
jgi:hypothetical protein